MKRSIGLAGLIPTALLGAGVFAAAAASIILSRDHTEISAVWAPNALVLAFLLRNQRGLWPLLLGAGYLANAAANLVLGNGWIIAGTVLVVSGVFLVTRFGSASAAK